MRTAVNKTCLVPIIRHFTWKTRGPWRRKQVWSWSKVRLGRTWRAEVNKCPTLISWSWWTGYATISAFISWTGACYPAVCSFKPATYFWTPCYFTTARCPTLYYHNVSLCITFSRYLTGALCHKRFHNGKRSHCWGILSEKWWHHRGGRRIKNASWESICEGWRR